MTDDGLEFVVLVAPYIPYNQIIQKKKPCLYLPDNTDNNMCCSLRLAYFHIPASSEKDKLAFGQKLHQDLGYDHDHKVGFQNWESSGREDYNISPQSISEKIVISDPKKLLFPTKDTLITQQSGCIYMTTIIVVLQIRQDFLHHLMSVSIVTSYTVQFYRTGRILLQCTVCLSDCNSHPGKSVKCTECERICRSQYCYEMHK